MLEYLLPVSLAVAVAIGQYVSDKKTEREFYKACGKNSWVGTNLSNPQDYSKINL